MKKSLLLLFMVLSAAVLWVSLKSEPVSAKGSIKCHMTFNLSSWSVFYKSGKGTGTVTCDNGEAVSVKIRTHGGGITFGKSKISGTGTFSKVDNISELFGSYAASEAHGGASESGGSQAMTKGDISLAITGSGKGWDVGFAFGSFKISQK